MHENEGVTSARTQSERVHYCRNNGVPGVCFCVICFLLTFYWLAKISKNVFHTHFSIFLSTITHLWQVEEDASDSSDSEDESDQKQEKVAVEQNGFVISFSFQT